MNRLYSLMLVGVALMCFAPSVSAAPLYTTQGVNASGFTNDSAACTVSIIQAATGNMVETHSITNDCMNKDTAYLDYSCWIYPANGTVSYTLLLDQRYLIGNYWAEVRCGNENSTAFTFTVTAPVLTVVDFNQFPQFLTTMKLMARTETERASECIARIIASDGTTTAVIPGVRSAKQGFFSFEHFLLWEAPYSNYTLNVTCNDFSTFETTFKPVFVDEGVLAKVTFGAGFQAVLVAAAVIMSIIVLVCAHLFWKHVTGGGEQ